MPKSACVKIVEWTGKQHRKVGVMSSTYARIIVRSIQAASVKAQVFTNFIPTFPLPFSPPKIARLPLNEHYFYPVSTAPIINRSQINSKER